MDIIQPLNIGDTIPESLWQLPLQVVNHPDGRDTITLNDYRGKLIILDFWATWCTACLNVMPRNDSLENLFGREQLVFLPITYEPSGKVRQFLSGTLRKNNTYNEKYTVTDDSLLRLAFEHRLIPHYVWIDRAGKVLSFTGNPQVTGANIKNALAEKYVNPLPKRDLDPNVPLFMSNGFFGDSLIGYSVLRKGIYEGLPSGNHYRRHGSKVTGRAITNTRLERIYTIVARELFRLSGQELFPNRIRFETRSGHPLSEYYNFQLIVPESQADSLYPLMLEELNRYLPYRAELIEETCSYYEIVPTEKTTALRSEKEVLNGQQLLYYLNSVDWLDAPVTADSPIPAAGSIEEEQWATKEQLVAYMKRMGLSLKKMTGTLTYFRITDK